MQLTKEQDRAVKLALQRQSFFFTGRAGTGKSTTLNFIVDALMEVGIYVTITASTGTAACQINGTTLHAFAGIGLGEEDSEQIYARLVRRNVQALLRWQQVQCLIVDEISMLDSQYLDTLEAVVSRIRGRPNFGGIQLIFSGDFSQLPPVRQGSIARRFVFQSDTWKRCIKNTVLLTAIHRQKDTRFIEVLDKIRAGIVDRKVMARIMETTYKRPGEGTPIKPTILYAKNIDVEKMNRDELCKLPGDHKVLAARDVGDVDLVKVLKRYSKLPEVLEIKVGAQVMLIHNLNVEFGLCNGARGVVHDFEYTEQGDVNGIRVNFAEAGMQLIAIHRESRSDRNRQTRNGSVPTATRSQFPLKLAWAMTIHKSQGMTCDCLEVDLSGCFEDGQVYTALSRGSSLMSMRVLNFHPSLVRCDPDVVEFERELLRKNDEYTSSSTGIVDVNVVNGRNPKRSVDDHNKAIVSTFHMPVSDSAAEGHR